MSDKPYSIHESAYLDDNVEVGEGTKIWHFCHVQSGARIGSHCFLGQNVNIANNVMIGDHVKIQNNVSIKAPFDKPTRPWAAPVFSCSTGEIERYSKLPAENETWSVVVVST